MEIEKLMNPGKNKQINHANTATRVSKMAQLNPQTTVFGSNFWATRCLPWSFGQNRVESHNSAIGANSLSVDKTVNENNLRRRRPWITSDTQPFNQEHWASNAHHLVMVAGHSVTVSGDLEDADRDENDWCVYLSCSTISGYFYAAAPHLSRTEKR